jgi:hypothetical protein
MGQQEAHGTKKNKNKKNEKKMTMGQQEVRVHSLLKSAISNTYIILYISYIYVYIYMYMYIYVYIYIYIYYTSRSLSPQICDFVHMYMFNF